MKNFTAIYDTKTYKNIEYAFQAKDMESAKEFASWKFDHANISNFKIIEDK